VRAELSVSSSSNSNRSRGQARPSLARSISSRSSRATSSSSSHLRAFSAGAADADALLGGGGGGGSSSGNGGGGSSSKPRPTDEAGDDDDDDEDDDTYLDAAAAAAAAASKGITLPADFLAAASSPTGLRASALASYAALFGGGGKSLSPIARALAAAFPFVRDRLLRDPRYLFKVGAEVAIDAGCATVAEVRKRGDEFWDEFEFYLSDLVVGCVLDVVLVTLMAPAMPIGRKNAGARALAATRSNSLAAKLVAPLREAASKVPSAVLEASVPGARPYSLAQRTGCLFVKFGEYSLAGMGCGLVGQSVANGLMAAKRKFSESRAAASAAAAAAAAEKEGGKWGMKKKKQPAAAAVVHLTPPPVGMTALTWGLFMGVSSNVRYQIVYGLERAVDMTVRQKFFIFFFEVGFFFFDEGKNFSLLFLSFKTFPSTGRQEAARGGLRRHARVPLRQQRHRRRELHRHGAVDRDPIGGKLELESERMRKKKTFFSSSLFGGFFCSGQKFFRFSFKKRFLLFFFQITGEGKLLYCNAGSPFFI